MKMGRGGQNFSNVQNVSNVTVNNFSEHFISMNIASQFLRSGGGPPGVLFYKIFYLFFNMIIVEEGNPA